MWPLAFLYKILLLSISYPLEQRGGYYSHVSQFEVFSVSVAKRKSRKNPRVAARYDAKCIISVHREACYWSRSEQ